jgi:hypothetical protein
MMADERRTKNRSGKVKSESKGKTLRKARAGRKKRPSGLELSRPPEEIGIMLELEAERVVDDLLRVENAGVVPRFRRGDSSLRSE